eukprot:CAMPEP_0114270900 /NCGR_PEP_ID=MMETSP0058-20121206/27531_1 /TAXON_ID=36894 /ORGANISM="Pyramimonas parkeae, CCMP726" /LENGTH=131 /DNA_ID=CAMNT_0001389761 /DNA_START=507 /DNA_END=902 /DNA_ORIENTATION=+
MPMGPEYMNGTATPHMRISIIPIMPRKKPPVAVYTVDRKPSFTVMTPERYPSSSVSRVPKVRQSVWITRPGYIISRNADVPPRASPLQMAYKGVVLGAQCGLKHVASARIIPTTPAACVQAITVAPATAPE